jgi:superfamily I DNA/RNA helicase
VSMFDGPPPMFEACKDTEHECHIVRKWIMDRLHEGCAPSELGVFVRSDAELKRARTAVKAAGARAVELSDRVEIEDGAIAISTMHFAKGLEFRSVVVMACDDDVIPQSNRIETVADEADLEEVYDTERHLLYVACTRARDHLLITGVAPVSEFVDDFLKGADGRN